GGGRRGGRLRGAGGGGGRVGGGWGGEPTPPRPPRRYIRSPGMDGAMVSIDPRSRKMRPADVRGEAMRLATNDPGRVPPPSLRACLIRRDPRRLRPTPGPEESTDEFRQPMRGLRRGRMRGALRRL